MKVQDELSFWLCVGLIIICLVNVINIIYLNFHIVFPIEFIIIQYLSIILFFPSIIFSLLYSIKKIEYYATLGFFLGLSSGIFQLLNILFNRSIIIFIAFHIFIISICSIIITIFSISIIFYRRNKITPIHEIKFTFKFHLSKSNGKILYIIGTVLIIIPQMPYIPLLCNIGQASEMADLSNIFMIFSPYTPSGDIFSFFYMLYLYFRGIESKISSQIVQMLGITLCPAFIGFILILIGKFLQTDKRIRS